eukprot:EG_transcript_13121
MATRFVKSPAMPPLLESLAQEDRDPEGPCSQALSLLADLAQFEAVALCREHPRCLVLAAWAVPRHPLLALRALGLLTAPRPTAGGQCPVATDEAEDVIRSVASVFTDTAEEVAASLCILGEAARSLRNLARWPALRPQLGPHLPTLLACLPADRFAEPGRSELRTALGEALVNAACHDANKAAILSVDGVQTLLTCSLDASASVSSQEVATAALGCLTFFHEPGQRRLMDGGAVPALLRHLARVVVAMQPQGRDAASAPPPAPGAIPELSQALSLVDVVCNCAVLEEGAQQVVVAEGVQTLVQVLWLTVHPALSADNVVFALRQKAGNTLVLVLKQVTPDPADPGVQSGDWRRYVSQFTAADGWAAVRACQPLTTPPGAAHCHGGAHDGCPPARSFVTELLQDLREEEPSPDLTQANTALRT